MPQARLSLPKWLYAKMLCIVGLIRLLAWTFLTLPFTGRLKQKFSGPDRLAKGLVLVLPGIEGESFLNHGIAHGLNDAGIDMAIEIFDWTRGRFFLFDNLMNLPRNRHQATLVAERIARYQKEYPNQPIYLVGHSGGTGIAAFALEQLPEDKPITGTLFLASGLSPDYDLVRTLLRTIRGIDNVYSRYDNFYLALATSLLGTIDRKHCLAAGRTSFRIPQGLTAQDADVYRTKLRQLAWSWEMIHAGHSSGHLGIANRRFTREWLSKMIDNR